jgi:large subunit ribosomal protein L10
MKKAEKQAFTTEFKSEAENADALYLTDFTGLDVKSMTLLRRRIRESGGRYLVVKNRLAKRAFDDLEISGLSTHLTGPTGIVLSKTDAVEPARVLVGFAKENNRRPAFKVGVVEGRVIGEEQFLKVATLPSRDVLMAQLAGALEGPMAAFAGALEGKLQEFAGLLDALKEQFQED